MNICWSFHWTRLVEARQEAVHLGHVVLERFWRWSKPMTEKEGKGMNEVKEKKLYATSINCGLLLGLISNLRLRYSHLIKRHHI